MLDLPRKGYKNICNGYYFCPQQKCPPNPYVFNTDTRFSFYTGNMELPPVLTSLNIPSGRIHNTVYMYCWRHRPLKTERLEAPTGLKKSISDIYKQYDALFVNPGLWGLHKLTCNCRSWPHKTTDILCLATVSLFGVDDS